MDTAPRIVIRTPTEEITHAWNMTLTKSNDTITLGIGAATYLYNKDDVERVLEIFCNEVLRWNFENRKLCIDSNLGLVKDTKGKHVWNDVQPFLELFQRVRGIKAPLSSVDQNYLI